MTGANCVVVTPMVAKEPSQETSAVSDELIYAISSGVPAGIGRCEDLIHAQVGVDPVCFLGSCCRSPVMRTSAPTLSSI